jgi:tagatose 6-phosphate kinase
MLDYACVGSISRKNVHFDAQDGMILAVTLNPALDVTHHVRHADWDGVNRPHQVLTRPGGKGLNVARVLRTLGADVRAIGLAGGLDGQAVRDGLAAAGVPAAFTPIAGPTRRTFTVVDEAAGRVAAFNEPGPAVSDEEYQQFLALFDDALAGCSVAVLSGSVPPGVPATGYAALTGTAVAAGVPVILDADGPALRHALAAGPAIVKPNLAELEHAAGRALRAGGTGSSTGGGEPDLDAVAGAARELTAAGAGAAVVSLGPRGLLAVTSDGTWLATPAARTAGNPTGAGDAAVAGLALGLSLCSRWEERLRTSAALGAAAVAAPAAGDISLDDYHRELDRVELAAIGG